jgi:dephospho-CoA kinase
MHVFGLTGGIACGKSTVAEQFRKHGVPVIDADQIAREVVCLGSPALAELGRVFGPAVFAKDGTLNRKALGALVFEDDAKRSQLNAILHPRIAARTAERQAELRAQGVKLACYDAALLVETGMADAFRPLVVVVASAAAQRERMLLRDGLTADESAARIAAQWSTAEKAKLADYLIVNDGTLEDLAARATAVLQAIRERVPTAAGGM